MEERSKRPHNMQIHDRQTLELTGVIEVISFDPAEVLLETELGRLTIGGVDLRVKRLTLEKGEVDMEGQINSLVYATGKKAEHSSLMQRLFG